ncbi:acyltransferase domain-containing protein, partial [Streptomyces johnsoniae]
MAGLPGGVVPWVLSGKDEGALRAQAARLREFVEARPELAPDEVAWSLVSTRAALERCAVVVGTGREELMEGLSRVVAGEPAGNVVSGRRGTPARPVFVFPGQGAQWVGMGVELAGVFPVFREALEECGRALSGFV